MSAEMTGRSRTPSSPTRSSRSSSLGELTRWVFGRDLGTRRHGQIEHLIATTPKISAGVDVARRWGELVAATAESATEQTYSFDRTSRVD